MNTPPFERRLWFYDDLTPDLAMLHRVDASLYAGRSSYQVIEVLRTRAFGVCLILDDKIQSSEADEFIYHEALVQPALLAHPGPRRVLIAGGGEGATLREVLRHRSVEKATMVDLDEQVVSVCKQYLPSWSAGAFDDPRTELIIGDARAFVETCGRVFDVIVIDLPDPIEASPARLLYTREFYAAVRKCLSPGGIMTVQCESSRWFDLDEHAAIVRTLRDVFRFVAPYSAHIPSFTTMWGFATASDSLDPTTLSRDEVDSRIAQRGLDSLRSYDGATHIGMFSLPRHIRAALDSGGRVITDSAPLSVY